MWIEIVVDLKCCLRNFKGRVFQFKATAALKFVERIKSNNGENSAIYLLLAEFEFRVCKLRSEFFLRSIYGPSTKKRPPKLPNRSLPAN